MSTVDGRHHVKVAVGHSWKSFALVLSVNEKRRSKCRWPAVCAMAIGIGLSPLAMAMMMML